MSYDGREAYRRIESKEIGNGLVRSIGVDARAALQTHHSGKEERKRFHRVGVHPSETVPRRICSKWSGSESFRSDRRAVSPTHSSEHLHLLFKLLLLNWTHGLGRSINLLGTRKSRVEDIESSSQTDDLDDVRSESDNEDGGNSEEGEVSRERESGWTKTETSGCRHDCVWGREGEKGMW